MDAEELQRRLTDCVYFLASPLTCKKGIECEYRHSEIARLNPRDCWYWLGGCCFNPDCAFRHPPLEGLQESYYESSNLNKAPPALPTDKTNVPCYFYSKGFCNKGEKCSFLHGPADVNPALKPSKPTTVVNNPVPSEKKLSEESKTRSLPVKSHPNPSESAQIDRKNTVRKPTQDSQQERISQNSQQERTSQDSQQERTLQDSQQERTSQDSQQERTSQDSQQERTTEDSQQESATEDSQQERSESPDISNSLVLPEEFVQSESDGFNDQSSGFDVLIDSESERLAYEQDVDYFSVHDEERGDPIEYDPAYPELGNGFIKERIDVCDRLDKVSGQARKSIFYRLSFKKRHLESEPIFKGRRGLDLREHLKKRKVFADGLSYSFSKGHDRNIRRHPQRKVVPVNRYKKPQFMEKGTIFQGPKPMQQKRRFKEKGTIFTGPKTLDEIREEKKNALERNDGFQGPRPLSEILKNKRKLG